MANTTLIATIADAHHGPKFDSSTTEANVLADQKMTDRALGLSRDFVAAVNDKHELMARSGQAVHAIVSLGDLIETPKNGSEAEARRLLEEALSPYSDAKMPVLTAIGNHDTMILGEQAVAEMLGRPRSYFSKDIGTHHVVVLYSKPANPLTGADVTISTEQLKWFEADLQATDRPTLVVVHHPIIDQDLSSNIWFKNHKHCAVVQNAQEVQDIIYKSGKVVAVLNGHTHQNSLEVSNGLAFITQGSLVENIGGSPAGTRGMITLKDGSFSMDIVGKNPAFSDHSQIVTETATTYDSIAREYAAATSQFGKPECDQFDVIAKRFFPHGGVVVDMGCGPARDARHFQSRGFEYIGVEASKKQVEIARQNLGLSTSAKVISGDFNDAAIAPESADVIWHSSTLQHVAHLMLPSVLRHAFNILKPGGIFYAHYRAHEGSPYDAESISISCEYGRPIARFISLFTEDEMNQHLRDAGFDVIDSKRFDHKYEGVKGVAVKYKTRVVARKPQDGSLQGAASVDNSIVLVP